jgi:hypothetical protein
MHLHASELASCLANSLGKDCVYKPGAEAELQQLRSQLEEAETTNEVCESLTRQLIYHARAHVWPQSMDLG